MPNQCCPIDETQKTRKDNCGTQCACYHLLANARKLHDKRWQTPPRIHQALKRVNRLAPTQSNTCKLDHTIRAGAQSGRLRIQHDKLNLVEMLTCDTPYRKCPLMFINPL